MEHRRKYLLCAEYTRSNYKTKCYELATKTVNGQRWIAQTVCERVLGHRTSYREGGPVVAWNDD